MHIIEVFEKQLEDFLLNLILNLLIKKKLFNMPIRVFKEAFFQHILQLYHIT